jgi:hypothetical protein
MMPKVTATPLCLTLDSDNLPEELEDADGGGESEQPESTLCERDWLDFSPSMRATSTSVLVHTSAPSSDLLFESSVNTPSSWMSDMAREMIVSDVLQGAFGNDTAFLIWYCLWWMLIKTRMAKMLESFSAIQ